MDNQRKLEWVRGHILGGAYREMLEEGLARGFNEWLEDSKRLSESDYELLAHEYLKERSLILPPRKKKKRSRPGATTFQLPTERRKPSDNWTEYAYLITGEKKIGKTSFAIQGCEEYVLQFDKPQLGYEILETCPDVWSSKSGDKVGFMQALQALEQAVEDMDFPFERIIIDGVGEWYQMCQTWACKQHHIAHPSDNESWGKTWTLLREQATDAVNRLLRLQETAGCGLVFITHSEWKEVKVGGGQKVDKLVPLLPKRCEELVNGKVDGWFTYDYRGTDRVLVLLGDENVGAGHRIDGHFLTEGGERIREVHMGGDAEEALANFVKAFHNDQNYVDLRDWKQIHRSLRKKGGKKRKKKSKQ